MEERRMKSKAQSQLQSMVSKVNAVLKMKVLKFEPKQASKSQIRREARLSDSDQEYDDQ